MTPDANDAVWRQLGASIDMLGNAIEACPEGLWFDVDREPQVWYLAYHTLFWLDLYLTGAVEGFAPPAPYGLEELDPAGVIPDRACSRAEMLAYLRHCREKARRVLAGLAPEDAERRCRFGWGDASFYELQIYNMRHVQHGAAQINLLLRDHGVTPPRWVARAKPGLGGD